MKLKLRLAFLDRIPSIGYSNPGFIFIDNNPKNIIGSYNLILDKKTGEHFADIEIEEGTSLDYYFYYISKAVNSTLYELDHFSFNVIERADSPAMQVKEMIVK